MSNHPVQREQAAGSARAGALDMRLEIAVIPVSDIDRAKRFYGDLGWRLDLDYQAEEGYRVIQFTPAGSACSVMFGENVTTAAPGSAQGHYLIVADIEAARAEMLRRGVEVGAPFHNEGGVFHHADGKDQVSGLNPQRKSYASYACFSDPDGNRWILQEVTARLSGDVEAGDSRFTSQIVNAIRSATAA
ncbi:Glyoxalase-like domain protein [Caballeronia glebae]|jgi:predicted enzyme related to lactoylglutathione lyase|uniref:Glyoxalase-like domain protein n=1 Tax=Caballeronia glebae TaxID=1777143 RepID=A0A158ATG6_9BURK|nr:VOC family protein [Caballeronia glebae]SAK60950.1 Glyoxalase-like domain protein [Caballeronia glebae]